MTLGNAFQNPRLAQALALRIRELAALCPPVTLMEVCGSHTMAIYRHGIRELLPSSVTLLSGPGCPVCVTPVSYLDRAVALARRPKTAIATFGDMLRVPSSSSSLAEERAKGADVRIIYSSLDAVEMASREPDHTFVLLAVGFETTTPTHAAAILEADRRSLSNFKVLAASKLVPPALKSLAVDGALRLHGLLCPGHVSLVIGEEPYEFLAREYGLACAIAGFEPVDILQGILMLLEQVKGECPRVDNAYRRVVQVDGNPVARALVDRVYETADCNWRGFGWLPQSGLSIRGAFRQYDAALIEVEVEQAQEPTGCACGDVLRGLVAPSACPLFGRVCTPDHPVGACMVSSEGTCAAAMQYGLNG